MFDRDASLAKACEQQRGLITAAECDALGVDRHARYRRVQAGLLVPQSEGVFRHAACELDDHATVLAAILAIGEGAYASGPSAMRMYDCRGEWDDTPEITVVGTTHVEQCRREEAPSRLRLAPTPSRCGDRRRPRPLEPGRTHAGPGSRRRLAARGLDRQAVRLGRR